MTWDFLEQHHFRVLAVIAMSLGLGRSICWIHAGGSREIETWHPIHHLIFIGFGLAATGILITLWVTYSFAAMATVALLSALIHFSLCSLLYLVRWILERLSK